MSNLNKRRNKPSLPQTALADSNKGSEPGEAHGRIAELAYGYWEARGRPLGSPEEDWFRAEDDFRVMLGSAND